MNNEINVLDEAKMLVDGERQSAYGSPSECIGRTATILTVLLNRAVSKKEVCLFNIAQKLARAVETDKRDNYIDLAGYVYIMEDKLD